MTSQTTPTQQFTPTNRTKVKRLPKRASYDVPLVHQILDEGLVCHVGFVVQGQPFVIPTAYGRVGNRLYIHGSPASRMLRSLQAGIEVCVTVTLIDGLVLARSAFHHSMNYRSVVLMGTASLVTDPEEKWEALHAFTDHVIRGRWEQVRQPNPQELQGTTVLSLPIHEASAKVRSGPPIDDEADYALSVWAGEVPLTVQAGTPIRDARVDADVAVPDYVQHYTRSQGNP